MPQSTSSGRRAHVIAGVLMSLALLGSMTVPADAQTGPFIYRLFLGDSLVLPASAVEMNAVGRQADTVSVTGPDQFFDVLTVGQRFSAAVIEVFDESLTLIRTFQLTPARIAALRVSGDAADLRLTIFLTGRSLTSVIPK